MTRGRLRAGGRAVATRALTPQEHQPRAHPLPCRQCLRLYLAAGIYPVTHARLYFTLLHPRPPLYPTQPGEGAGPAARPAYGSAGSSSPPPGPARLGPALPRSGGTGERGGGGGAVPIRSPFPVPVPVPAPTGRYRPGSSRGAVPGAESPERSGRRGARPGVEAAFQQVRRSAEASLVLLLLFIVL